MVPVIRIKDETWERLKAWAIPLEDSPDDALSRVLNEAERHRHCKSQNGDNVTPERAILRESEFLSEFYKPEAKKEKRVYRRTSASLIPLEDYKLPILLSLHELGGSARRMDVLACVERRMKDRFGAAELAMIPSGQDVRWRRRAEWARYVLAHEDGLIKTDSRSGIWELTSRGSEEAGKSNL